WLTSIVRGLALESGLVGTQLLPVVVTNKDDEANERGPKYTVALTDYGYDSATVVDLDDLESVGTGAYPIISFSEEVQLIKLRRYHIAAEISDETVDILEDLGKTNVIDNYVVRTAALYNRAVEAAIAKVATTTANYPSTHVKTLSDTDKWSHDDSNPVRDVRDAIARVWNTCGIVPDLLVLPFAVANRLAVHPKVVAQIRYTEGIGPLDDATLARALGVQRVAIARALQVRPGLPPSGTPWGNHAVLAATMPGNAQEPRRFAGAVFRARGYPLALEPQRDPKAPRIIAPIRDWMRITWLDGGAAYLFRDVL
ncbi:MAG: hypothetical protein RML32_00475, partial [Gammaproteobacteria bacterium]|nr:hypothetical protein [Gammaproteobacteria bacterium]